MKKYNFEAEIKSQKDLNYYANKVSSEALYSSIDGYLVKDTESKPASSYTISIEHIAEASKKITKEILSKVKIGDKIYKIQFTANGKDYTHYVFVNHSTNKIVYDNVFYITIAIPYKL